MKVRVRSEKLDLPKGKNEDERKPEPNFGGGLPEAVANFANPGNGASGPFGSFGFKTGGPPKCMGPVSRMTILPNLEGY